MHIADDFEFREVPDAKEETQFQICAENRTVSCKVDNLTIKREWIQAAAEYHDYISSNYKFQVSGMDGMLVNVGGQALPWMKGSNPAEAKKTLHDAHCDIAFESNPHLVSKDSLFEGDLSKLGGQRKSWRRRYFVLYPRKMEYYRHQKDKKALGGISLTMETVVQADVLAHTFAITPVRGGRTYVITAASERSCNQWMALIEANVEGVKVIWDKPQRPTSISRSLAPGALMLASTKTNSKSIKEGWLFKLGKNVTNWKRRYFVLLPDKMTYYKQANSKRAQNYIKLTDKTSIGPIGIPNTFAISTGHRKYVITAKDAKEREDWLTALQGCADGKLKVTFPAREQLESKDADQILHFILESTGKAAVSVQKDFVAFCKRKLCDENAMFCMDVENFKCLDVVDGSPEQFLAAQEIWEKYLKPQSELQVCMPTKVLNQVRMDLAETTAEQLAATNEAREREAAFHSKVIAFKPEPSVVVVGRDSTPDENASVDNNNDTSPAPPTQAVTPTHKPPLPEKKRKTVAFREVEEEDIENDSDDEALFGFTPTILTTTTTNIPTTTTRPFSKTTPPIPSLPRKPNLSVSPPPTGATITTAAAKQVNRSKQRAATTSSPRPPPKSKKPIMQAFSDSDSDEYEGDSDEDSDAESGFTLYVVPKGGVPSSPVSPTLPSRAGKKRLSIASSDEWSGDSDDSDDDDTQGPPGLPSELTTGEEVAPKTIRTSVQDSGVNANALYNTHDLMFEGARKLLFSSLRDHVMPKYLAHVPESAVATWGLAVLEEQNRSVTELATLEELLMILTDVKARLQGDKLEYRRAFMLNYESFTDAETLFHHIQKVYSEPESKLPHSVASKLHVALLLQDWITSFPQDFNSQLEGELDATVTQWLAEAQAIVKRQRTGSELAVSQAAAVTKLCLKLEQKVEALELAIFKVKKQAQKTVPSVKLSPGPEGYIDLSDPVGVEAKKMAWMMTVVDAYSFYKIQPREFARKGWTVKGSAQRTSPNILRMVDGFNARSYWVATEILKDETRAGKAISYFIRLAYESFQIRNFFSLFAIVMGLSLGPVYRLKSAWQKLDTPSKTKFDEIKNRVTDPSRNCTQYRTIFRKGLGGPQIPHIAVVLKDCFQLEEIPTLNDGKVHFGKYDKQYQQLREIFQSQNHPFNFATALVEQGLAPPPTSPKGHQGGSVWQTAPTAPTPLDLSGATAEAPLLARIRLSIEKVVDQEVLLGEEDLWARSYVLEPKGSKPAGS